eukprot:4653944-Prymnesium_polylepis.1
MLHVRQTHQNQIDSTQSVRGAQSLYSWCAQEDVRVLPLGGGESGAGAQVALLFSDFYARSSGGYAKGQFSIVASLDRRGALDLGRAHLLQPDGPNVTTLARIEKNWSPFQLHETGATYVRQWVLDGAGLSVVLRADLASGRLRERHASRA